MAPLTSNISGKTKRRRTALMMALAVGVIVVVLAVIGILKLNASHQPDLGPGLEYIGKRDAGCALFWCDAKQYSVYYFATNMDERELEIYFKHATYVKVPSDFGGASADGYTFDTLSFQTTRGEHFDLDYYHGGKPSEMNFGLRQTNRAYGIDMTDRSYKIAKLAL